jgi:H+/Cl- antiporter ClcA
LCKISVYLRGEFVNKKVKRYMLRLKTYGVNLLILSVLTGIFAGVVVTFYNILASYGEDCARGLYELLVTYPAFIPLLFVGLVVGAVLIGTLVKFVPMIRGSGIPQIEGAARGDFTFKWYTVMCSMFAASLACIFMGLGAGAEGPSIELGGCAGDAIGGAFKRTQMVRRMQIAGGASAGFAVAFNAPITGMIFALEEAFRSFSPQVFMTAAVSVIVALLTRSGIRYTLNLAFGYEKFSLGYSLKNFVFVEIGWQAYIYIAVAALVVALAAVAFYYCAFGIKKLFGKVTFLKGVGKYIIPFVFAGVAGLITRYSIGGGHEFIQSLATGGTGKIEIEQVFGTSIIVSLVIIMLLRFLSISQLTGCGVPCGVFIPMLAVGAGMGATLSIIFQQMGMDGAYSDYLIIICMAVFFVTFVRAPITGLCMIFELTGQVQNFLPALLGIVIGYLVSELARLKPGYEKSLELFIEEQGYQKNKKKVTRQVLVMPNSTADGGMVKKIIWPHSGLVVSVVDGDGKSYVPNGETVLHAGETITFECETNDEDKLLSYLYEVVGKPNK